MLEHLVVENLVLVDRVELGFGPGLNVLTGETGAGKSVLVRALSLVLGGRAQLDTIRTGVDEAVVEALFTVTPGSPLAFRLEERGVSVEEGALVVRRVIGRSGRGRVSLNGQMVTASMLADVMRGVVDVTSQHEHVSLLDPETHLEVLDAFGGHLGLRSAYAESHAAFLAAQAALSALNMDEAEKARREDYLRFALDELQRVDPQLGELEALEEERTRLRHATDLMSGVQRAEAILYSDEGAVVDSVGRIERELERLMQLDERLAPTHAQLRGVVAELEDLARGLSRYQSNLSAEPARLDEVEERLDELKKLSRKYGGTIESVLKTRDALAVELDALEHDEARKAALVAELERHEAARLTQGGLLSEARRRAIGAFEDSIKRELADLSMAGTRFSVTLRPQSDPSAVGLEQAEFEIAPNMGEPLRPLKRVASGGELSRVLLAVKRVLADRGAVSTFVFDEVDTGIGGAVADVLGTKLKDVAEGAQVICVTHLPQIAAYADHHFRVEKTEIEGRTVTRLYGLGAAACVEELARMLGGVEITDRTRALAKELKSRSAAKKDGRSADVNACAQTPESGVEATAEPADKGRGKPAKTGRHPAMTSGRRADSRPAKPSPEPLSKGGAARAGRASSGPRR
ncbi:MAG: DNA repair protein RecN [Deltaproteobacteria bacterium]|nr:DNA repair protein RecN [Deltaproteobacteria bacterium]